MVPVLTLLIFMGLNNSDVSIFTGQLYSNYPILFILPALTAIAGIMVIYYGQKQKGRQLFIHAVAVVALLIMTGYVGIFPNVLHSSIAREFSISIEESMSSINTLRIAFWAVVILFPIVIGYQGWKYFSFNDKVKLNDE